MEEFFKNKKDTTDFVIALIVILSTIGFILYQSELSENSFFAPIVLEDEQSRAPLDLNIEGETKTFIPVKENIKQPERRVKSKNNQAKEKSSFEFKKDSSSFSVSKNNSSPSIEDYEVSKKKAVEKNVISTIKEKTITAVDSTKDYLLNAKKPEVIKKEEIKEKVEVVKKSVEKVKEKIAVPEKIIPREEAEDCVILIGAFQNNSNLSRLTKRLENSNYKIFKKPFRGLTRLGVFLPCDQATLDAELKKFRSKYASDAFVLKTK